MKLFIALLSAVALTLGAYDLKNPALTPVDFGKTPSHGDIQLIKNGAPQFAIIADLKSEFGGVRAKSIAPAVEELKITTQKCTGKVPEVFTSAQIADALKKYPYVIVLGDNPVARKYVNVKKLIQEGFEIVTFDKGIVIAGTDSSLDKITTSIPSI